MNNKDSKKIVELGGKIKQFEDAEGKKVEGVLFNDPSEAPENSLFIPLKDFGYTKKHGIFRKSLRPNWQNEINL